MMMNMSIKQEGDVEEQREGASLCRQDRQDREGFSCVVFCWL